MAVTFSDQYLSAFVDAEEYTAIAPQVQLAHEQLHAKTGMGNDFLGWVDLPTAFDRDEFASIKKSA